MYANTRTRGSLNRKRRPFKGAYGQFYLHACVPTVALRLLITLYMYGCGCVGVCGSVWLCGESSLMVCVRYRLGQTATLSRAGNQTPCSGTRIRHVTPPKNIHIRNSSLLNHFNKMIFSFENSNSFNENGKHYLQNIFFIDLLSNFITIQLVPSV